ALESLAAVRTVKAYGLQKFIHDKYKQSTELAYHVACKAGYQAGGGYGLYWFLIFAASAFGFWYGGKIIISQTESGECQNPTDDDEDEEGKLCNTSTNVIGTF